MKKQSCVLSITDLPSLLRNLDELLNGLMSAPAPLQGREALSLYQFFCEVLQILAGPEPPSLCLRTVPSNCCLQSGSKRTDKIVTSCLRCKLDRDLRCAAPWRFPGGCPLAAAGRYYCLTLSFPGVARLGHRSKGRLFCLGRQGRGLRENGPFDLGFVNQRTKKRRAFQASENHMQNHGGSKERGS